MDTRYAYLCAVAVDDKLYSAIFKHKSVFPGDLVTLDNGVRGTVTRTVFVDTESDEYAFFTDFIAVDEIVELHRRVWCIDDESEDE